MFLVLLLQLCCQGNRLYIYIYIIFLLITSTNELLNPSAVKGMTSPTKPPRTEAKTICLSGKSSSPSSGINLTPHRMSRGSSVLYCTPCTLGQGQRTPLRKESTPCTPGQGQRTPFRKESTPCTPGQGPGTTSGKNSTTHTILHKSPITLGEKGIKRKAPSLPLTNLRKRVRLSPPYKKRLRTRAKTTKRENTRSQSNTAVKKATLAQDKNTSTPSTHSKRKSTVHSTGG